MATSTFNKPWLAGISWFSRCSWISISPWSALNGDTRFTLISTGAQPAWRSRWTWRAWNRTQTCKTPKTLRGSHILDHKCVSFLLFKIQDLWLECLSGHRWVDTLLVHTYVFMWTHESAICKSECIFLWSNRFVITAPGCPGDPGGPV